MNYEFNFCKTWAKCLEFDNKFTGWVDIGLSENGVKEASNAGDLLINENLSLIFALRRSQKSIDTADILLNRYENKLNNNFQLIRD